MKFLYGLLVLFLLITAGSIAVFAQEEPTEEKKENETTTEPEVPSDVVVLTEKNFHEVLKAADVALVEFYAPWCGHCKALAPIYEKAATLMKGKVMFAKVDCTVEEKLSEENDIRGFPTLKVFRNGEFAGEYNGERTPEALVAFMEKQLLPPSQEIKTEEDAEKLSKDEKYFNVLGFFNKAEGPEFESFTKVANRLRNGEHQFGHIVDPELAKKFKVETFPTIILYKGGDDIEKFTGPEFTTESLQEFFKKNQFRLLDEISGQNFGKYFASEQPMGVLFIKTSENNDEVKSLIREIAKDYKGKINFVYADGERFARQARRLGLKGDTFPALSIDMLRKPIHYAFPETQQFNKENLHAFFDSFLEGKLEPTMRSQPIPETNDEPVKVVVGKSFNQIVMDETKDVLLELYAPWCGHCKALAPIYEDLAKRLLSIPTVVIAKIDATENDLPPEHMARGYPTLKFFPAKNKSNPITFEEERTLENLLAFVHDHASFPFDIPPEEKKPEEVMREEKPEEVKVEEPKPSEVKVEEVKTEEKKPEEVKPEEVKPEEKKPTEIKHDEL